MLSRINQNLDDGLLVGSKVGNGDIWIVGRTVGLPVGDLEGKLEGEISVLSAEIVRLEKLKEEGEISIKLFEKLVSPLEQQLRSRQN